MHEIDTWMFFKYFFKMWVAVYLVTNTFTIAMAVFDVGQHVVSAAGGVINSQTAINVDSMLEAMETAMESMEIGELGHTGIGNAVGQPVYEDYVGADHCDSFRTYD